MWTARLSFKIKFLMLAAIAWFYAVLGNQELVDKMLMVYAGYLMLEIGWLVLSRNRPVEQKV